MPSNPIFTSFVQQYPFKSAHNSSGHTDDEFKDTSSQEKYQAMIIERIKQSRK